MLSQRARYALRALIHIADSEDGEPIGVATIAEAQAVPRKFLEAIMTDLKKGGIVTSRRGPGGGFVLAKAANDISFADVIWLIDGPIALVPCASENFYARCGDCHDEATCQIRKVMARVRTEAVDILAGTSLAQASAKERGVRVAEF